MPSSSIRWWAEFLRVDRTPQIFSEWDTTQTGSSIRASSPLTHLNAHCFPEEADVLPYIVQQYHRMDNNFTEISHSSEVCKSRYWQSWAGCKMRLALFLAIAEVVKDLLTLWLKVKAIKVRLFCTTNLYLWLRKAGLAPIGNYECDTQL